MTQGLRHQLSHRSVDARARDHVVVRRAVGLKVAEVAERAGGAAPEQRDGAAVELADRRRAQVLLGAAVAEEAAPSAHSHQRNAQEHVRRGQTVAHLDLERRSTDDAAPGVALLLRTQEGLKRLLRVLEVAGRVEDEEGPLRVDGAKVRAQAEAVEQEAERGHAADGMTAQDWQRLPREGLDRLVQDEDQVAVGRIRGDADVQLLERGPEIDDNLRGPQTSQEDGRT